jgi:hypothetical protein
LPRRPRAPSTVVHSQVDPAAITKVTRLFNTLGSILTELIQNARRAGATTVDLDVAEADDRQWLVIADDGAGIADPRSFSRSGARDGTTTSRPAKTLPAWACSALPGAMSKFVRVRAPAETPGGSRSRPATGKRAVLSVYRCDHRFGTEIRLPLQDD